MNYFFTWFIDKVYSIVDVLRLPTFNIGGFNVSFFDCILGCIVISIVVGVVWKGARGWQF